MEFNYLEKVRPVQWGMELRGSDHVKLGGRGGSMNAYVGQEGPALHFWFPGPPFQP